MQQMMGASSWPRGSEARVSPLMLLPTRWSQGRMRDSGAEPLQLTPAKPYAMRSNTPWNLGAVCYVAAAY